ncbi:hypothetical protein [uncultured Kriegella sp.]|uniref:hypothetical protein n=1 Tax=uncultured Kriegella sp. TaxID=1798910 RepID=UPI0030DB0C4C|tara:strand:+ start:110441 stop:110896 length:456 start_codon:yes stop_codon:yes gene_type:complete
MKKNSERWEDRAENLLAEIRAAKKAYSVFVTSDRYPHKQHFFKKQYFRLKAFVSILEDEMETVNGSNRLENPNDQHIFEKMEFQILEGNLTDVEVDTLIVQKEQELLILYQEVLGLYIPDVTKAILQSQAEELNNDLQKSKADLRTIVGTM